jgi:hypothetical protein
VCSVVTAKTLTLTITVQPSATPIAPKHIKTKMSLAMLLVLKCSPELTGPILMI